MGGPCVKESVMYRWRRPLQLTLVALTFFAATSPTHTQTPTPDPTAEFFDDSVLHELKLWINSRDWETLKTNFLSNAYYPADFQWQTTTVRNVGIRSRGNGSRSGFKPGLRVDIDRYSTTQKFLGLKSFVLRNNTQDPSQMHEWLSMLFFRRMALPASREAFARLFVNNQYVGLYTIVESVDKSFLSRQFGEDSGYLFDYDYPAEAAPYYFEDRGRDASSYVPLPFKPETRENNSRPEVIADMVQSINGSGAAFRSAVAEFIDLSQFIRHVATEVFLAEQDGILGEWGMNNFFMYRPEISHQFRLIVWDKSQAFVQGQAYSIWHNITDVPEANRNRLMSRALESPDLRELYLDMLLEAGRVASEVPPGTLPGDTRGWLEREIDRGYALIAPSVLADTLKPYTNDEFETSVESLRLFARQRTAFVTTDVAASRAIR
jgi:spore coat protein CotH